MRKRIAALLLLALALAACADEFVCPVAPKISFHALRTGGPHDCPRELSGTIALGENTATVRLEPPASQTFAEGCVRESGDNECYVDVRCDAQPAGTRAFRLVIHTYLDTPADRGLLLGTAVLGSAPAQVHDAGNCRYNASAVPGA